VSESPLAGRTVLLVVGGGISAYKSVIVARELLRRGARVETVMTASAQKFVGAVTFAGVTSRAPHVDLWDASFAGELHIELTRTADVIVVAPATANLLARAAHGLADDLASTVLLSAQQPLLLAPAMHARMWNHPATQANVRVLAARGATMVGPTEGPLASGEVGIGRMAEPEDIVSAAETALAGDLRGQRILITAGPTHEPIDPVRFIGNRSSGKMGVALAEAARARGATVTIVHGPMSAPVPASVREVSVRTAVEMREEVLRLTSESDVVIMAAAVADYRPATVAKAKIKKDSETLSLELVKNPDLLADLGTTRGDERRPVLVGFAVESADLITLARRKLVAKHCDIIVANLADDGFEGDDNVVTLVYPDREVPLGRLPKRVVADRVLDAVKAIGHSDTTRA